MLDDVIVAIATVIDDSIPQSVVEYPSLTNLKHNHTITRHKTMYT